MFSHILRWYKLFFFFLRKSFFLPFHRYIQFSTSELCDLIAYHQDHRTSDSLVFPLSLSAPLFLCSSLEIMGMYQTLQGAKQYLQNIEQFVFRQNNFLMCVLAELSALLSIRVLFLILSSPPNQWETECSPKRCSCCTTNNFLQFHLC